MKECLVDVLNARDTVLHVFPIAVENEDGTPRAVDPVQEALQVASHLQLVPETETLHAREHVSRGGPLMPFGDVLKVRCDMQERAERRIRERAYFIWLNEGCPEGRADEHWRHAGKIEGSGGIS